MQPYIRTHGAARRLRFLMDFADRSLKSEVHSRVRGHYQAVRSRSYLSCHQRLRRLSKSWVGQKVHCSCQWFMQPAATAQTCRHKFCCAPTAPTRCVHSCWPTLPQRYCGDAAQRGCSASAHQSPFDAQCRVQIELRGSGACAGMSRRLADSQQPRFASGGMLPGHQPEPCRELSASTELFGIADRGNKCAGG